MYFNPESALQIKKMGGAGDETPHPRNFLVGHASSRVAMKKKDTVTVLRGMMGAHTPAKKAEGGHICHKTLSYLTQDSFKYATSLDLIFGIFFTKNQMRDMTQSVGFVAQGGANSFFSRLVDHISSKSKCYVARLQHTATRCNTLHHTATL